MSDLEKAAVDAIAGFAWRVPPVRKWAREQVREDKLKRSAEAYRRFGVEVDGVHMLPDTPEVEDFLSGTSEKS